MQVSYLYGAYGCIGQLVLKHIGDSIDDMPNAHKSAVFQCCIIFLFIYFIYLGFYVAFNTVQVISRRVVGRAEETQWANLHHLDIKMAMDLMSINCLFLIWFESSNDIIFTTSK